MTFGDYLREKRLAAGLTQKQAAELAGMKEPQYQKYELGIRACPSFPVVIRLARALNFGLDDCAAAITNVID